MFPRVLRRRLYFGCRTASWTITGFAHIDETPPNNYFSAPRLSGRLSHEDPELSAAAAAAAAAVVARPTVGPDHQRVQCGTALKLCSGCRLLRLTMLLSTCAGIPEDGCHGLHFCQLRHHVWLGRLVQRPRSHQLAKQRKEVRQDNSYERLPFPGHGDSHITQLPDCLLVA